MEDKQKQNKSPKKISPRLRILWILTQNASQMFGRIIEKVETNWKTCILISKDKISILQNRYKI